MQWGFRNGSFHGERRNNVFSPVLSHRVRSLLLVVSPGDALDLLVALEDHSLPEEQKWILPLQVWGWNPKGRMKAMWKYFRKMLLPLNFFRYPLESGGKQLWLHFDDINLDWGRIKWISKCLDYWAASQWEHQTGKCAHLEKRKLANFDSQFGNRSFRLQVVSPASRFAYIEVVSPRRPKSFRLNDLSRFTYIEVDSPTLRLTSKY